MKKRERNHWESVFAVMPEYTVVCFPWMVCLFFKHSLAVFVIKSFNFSFFFWRDQCRTCKCLKREWNTVRSAFVPRLEVTLQWKLTCTLRLGPYRRDARTWTASLASPIKSEIKSICKSLCQLQSLGKFVCDCCPSKEEEQEREIGREVMMHLWSSHSSGFKACLESRRVASSPSSQDRNTSFWIKRKPSQKVIHNLVSMKYKSKRKFTDTSKTERSSKINVKITNLISFRLFSSL